MHDIVYFLAYSHGFPIAQTLKSLVWFNGKFNSFSRNMHGFNYRTVITITVIINYRSLLLHGSDYKVSKINRVSHIWWTYFTSYQASEATAKYEKQGKHGTYCMHELTITSLSPTQNTSTVC